MFFAFYGPAATTGLECLRLEIAHKTVSMANSRMHWAARAKKVKAERQAISWAFRAQVARDYLRRRQAQWGWDIALVRGAPSSGLDDDNLRSALKSVRDEVTRQLGFPNDRCEQLRWDYDQQRTPRGVYWVEIRLTPRSKPSAQAVPSPEDVPRPPP